MFQPVSQFSLMRFGTDVSKMSVCSRWSLTSLVIMSYLISRLLLLQMLHNPKKKVFRKSERKTSKNLIETDMRITLDFLKRKYNDEG
jgi:hypothetical protein